MLMEEAGDIARLIDTMPRLPVLVRSVDLSARARVLLRHPERGSLRADSQAPWKTERMTKKQPAQSSAVTAADIERSIQALNRMAERLWGEGREAEAQALINALDGLNRALDRIRIGESRRIVTLH